MVGRSYYSYRNASKLNKSVTAHFIARVWTYLLPITRAPLFPLQMSARLQWMQLLIEMFSVVTDAFEMSHLLQDMLVIVEGGMCCMSMSVSCDCVVCCNPSLRVEQWQILWGVVYVWCWMYLIYIVFGVLDLFILAKLQNKFVSYLFPS